VNVINFNVNREGLEDQLLSIVVSKEMPEVEIENKELSR